jgi:hypothetical protein
MMKVGLRALAALWQSGSCGEVAGEVGIAPNEARCAERSQFLPRRTKPIRDAPNEAIGKMDKAPNEAKESDLAPNEAIGKLGKAPNEASDLLPRAERSHW